MQIVKIRSHLAFAILVIALTTTLAAYPGRNQEKSQSAGKRISDTKNEDDNLGPIVDYEVNYKPPRDANPRLQALRQTRGARYTRGAPRPLGELEVSSEGYAVLTEWEVGLPPLPVSQSDAVIFGKVVDAQAHLSNDRTAVYSEFNVLLEEVFKNSTGKPLTVNESLVAEREGGVVRFQSGRLLPYKIFHQGMPRTGGHYIFFLKYNEQGEDYHIVTAFELRHNRISPLDDLEKFAIYKGFSKEQFRNAIQEAIAHQSQQDGNPLWAL